MNLNTVSKLRLRGVGLGCISQFWLNIGLGLYLSHNLVLTSSDNTKSPGFRSGIGEVQTGSTEVSSTFVTSSTSFDFPSHFITIFLSYLDASIDFFG